MADTWACPKCKSTKLDVTLEVWARLYQEADGNFQTDTDEAHEHDHIWGENSPMLCRDCGHGDIAGEFGVEEEEDEAGDDLCDTCMSSGVNVARTHKGKTVGIECGCDATLDDDDDEEGENA